MIKGSRLAQLGVLCLLLATGAIALSRSGLLRTVGAWGVFLLCPLMHVVMMLFMGRSCHGGRDSAKKAGEAPHVPETVRINGHNEEV